MGFLLIALLVGVSDGTADTTVVARVGRFVITADELMTSYEFGPAFVKRLPDPLRRHLAFMIDERLLALDAERLGYDTTPFVRDRQAALTEDLAVEELYREEILSRVHPSDEQIAWDMRRANTTVALRWIFTATEKEARSIQRMLERGAPFDSLFEARRDTSTGSGDRSLETTALRLERDNPEVARVVEGLPAEKISAPVRGPDGYYLFRVDRSVQLPIVTETEAGRLRQEAVTIRTRVAADSIADTYVKRAMKASNPVIKAEGFNIVRALIADRGLTRSTKLEWDIPSTFMTEAGPVPISASGTMMDRTLVSFGEKAFTVRDYAVWYDLRQFQLDTRSREAFNSSVKKTIWKMVQDRLLSEEAKARGMFVREDVQRHAEAWNAKILYLAGRSVVLRTIRITDGELRTKYDQSRKRYLDRSGRIRPFNEVRDHLWEEAYAEREARVLRERLAELSAVTNVWINESALRIMAVGVKPDARPLEAVFYKPGGTFPRVAFPSIDEAWERTW